MLQDITVTVTDLEALAAKLDALEGLDDQERATLTGAFLLAGQAISYRADDVSGFALNFSKGSPFGIDFCHPDLMRGTTPGGGIVHGFNVGLHGSGGGAGFPTDQ